MKRLRGWMMAIVMLLAGVNGARAQTNPIELWAGYDPTAEPLEIEVLRTWDEGSLRFEELFFTAETWEGQKVRMFAYRGAPASGEKLPGILHLHGGGQTASLDWVRYWAKRGYVAVSHDFAGRDGVRDPNKTTDWASAPANMLKPTLPTSTVQPTPRFSAWYHWILAGRRALTLIQQHPQVDPEKLGVYGISVGGTLTWMVAGSDARVKAAAPIYGAGQNTYTFPWQTPEEGVTTDTVTFRNTLECEAYAPLVKCPLLFMNASNDHHGRLDLSMRTLALATNTPILREIYTPLAIHHIGPAEAVDLPLWMDWHLKGRGRAWPASPKLTATVANGAVQMTVTTDDPMSVTGVKIYYGLNNPWPASRFYRTVQPAFDNGGVWTAAAPIMHADDTIYAFANVEYNSGVKLSTRLIKVGPEKLAGAVPTLTRMALIDTMDTDEKWFWWQAPTDPLNLKPLIKRWNGPDGQQGFTHAQPKGISFATNVLGDPQYATTGTQALLIDVWAEALPEKLNVQATTEWFVPGQLDYFGTGLPLAPAVNGWATLRIQPGDLKTADAKPLESWAKVNFFVLSGKASGETVFKNLRWE